MCVEIVGASDTYDCPDNVAMPDLDFGGGCVASFPADAEYNQDIADAFEAGGDSVFVDRSEVAGGSAVFCGSEASDGRLIFAIIHCG